MKRSPLLKIVITIIAALLIPVTSYTVFQFTQSNANEELLKSIYNRQLDSILFSVNQHCWDTFNSWVTEINIIASADPEGLSEKKITSRLETFTRNNATVDGVFLRFSTKRMVTFLSPDSKRKITNFNVMAYNQKLDQIFSQSSSNLDRLMRRAKEGYVKSFAVQWNISESERTTLLIFPVIFQPKENQAEVLAGIFIDDIEYINETVGRKFSAMDDGTFNFAVKDNEKEKIYFSTEDVLTGDFEKSEKLWILPKLDLQIKLSGTTLDQISKARTITNLIFLALVNIVLIFGVVYLVRNVYNEISLAKMKTSFVANVSHELRTPLALIRMYAETLEMGRIPTEEKKQHYYRTIMSESARLTQLVNNILDFSKMESLKKKYVLVKTNFSDLICDILKIYQFHLDQKGFELTVDIEPDLPEIFIDSAAVKQAFMNLLDNAVKFSQDRKKICVSLKMNNNTQVLSVQDFGIGILKSEQKNIFNKFYRAESHMVHNLKGSGLGLSLVKHIMEQHEGQVLVNSNIGEGSIFSLIFPQNGIHGA